MTNGSEATTLQILCRSDIGLRVVFERQNDRWAHAVEVLSGNKWERLLESVEGAAADAWPTSPPLQHLHFEERPNGQRVALAVGMAGRGHWSASIEADAVTKEIRFDVACRASTQPGFIGTDYRFLAPLSSEFDGDDTRLIRLHSLDHELAACLRPISARVHVASDGRVPITPDKAPASFPATVRWQYSISLERPA